MEKMGQKQRVTGKNMTKDWNTSTQYNFTVEEETKVTILGYPENRTDNCEKLVAFCLVEGKDYHRVPSFQQDGLGFGTFKPLEWKLEPKLVYTVVTYCTDDAVQGPFGLCVFTKKGTPKVTIKESVEWKHSLTCKGEWMDNTAGGAGESRLKNLKFQLTNKEKKSATVLVMLRQVNKTLETLVFADGGHKIIPSKYYVGFYVLDVSLGKDITQTEKWCNSYDVYKFLEVEGGESIIILPATQNEGEEMAYEIHAYSDSKITLTQFK